MNGSDLGAAMARGLLVMFLLAIAIGGWALWHFVLSHIQWSWS